MATKTNPREMKGAKPDYYTVHYRYHKESMDWYSVNEYGYPHKYTTKASAIRRAKKEIETYGIYEVAVEAVYGSGFFTTYKTVFTKAND